jgi:hypothetical protein
VTDRDFPVPPPLEPGRRYTIRIMLKPDDEEVEYRAVTALGELKASAMAALRLVRDRPEARFSTVEVVNVETDFTLDPQNDLRDYWGLE